MMQPSQCFARALRFTGARRSLSLLCRAPTIWETSCLHSRSRDPFIPILTMMPSRPGQLRNKVVKAGIMRVSANPLRARSSGVVQNEPLECGPHTTYHIPTAGHPFQLLCVRIHFSCSCGGHQQVGGCWKSAAEMQRCAAAGGGTLNYGPPFANEVGCHPTLLLWPHSAPPGPSPARS